MEEENYGEIFRKLETGEEMDEWERKNLVTMARGLEDLDERQKDLEFVQETEGDHRRNYRYAQFVFRYKGKLYAIDYLSGQTDSAEDEFDNDPYPVREIQSVKTISNYVPVVEAEESGEDTSLVVWLENEPQFGERLAQLRQKWESYALRAEAATCSRDTYKELKKERAALTKEYNEVEKQRKGAIAPVKAKIDGFNALYKGCVTDAYKRADAAYKSKIEAEESAIKGDCIAACRAAWDEICQRDNIDFVPWERTGITIGMTEANAVKQPPAKIVERLEAVSADICASLKTISDKGDTEVLAEYRKCLNLNQAFQTVTARREEIEAARKAAERKEEQDAREAAAVAAVEEAVAEFGPPTISVPAEEDVVYPEVALRLKNVSKAQLLRLKEYLIKEGITYAW